jgi:hypothetical protein
LNNFELFFYIFTKFKTQFVPVNDADDRYMLTSIFQTNDVVSWEQIPEPYHDGYKDMIAIMKTVNDAALENAQIDQDSFSKDAYGKKSIWKQDITLSIITSKPHGQFQQLHTDYAADNGN